MSLALKQLVQVDISGKYLWSTDKTGAYDVTTNPGGWGAPNPNLNQSALLVVGYRVSSDEQLILIGNQVIYNPSALNTDEFQWQMNYPSKDGWIQFFMMRIWVSSDGINDISNTHYLLDGDFFYIPAQGNVYVKNGSGGSAYQQVTDLLQLTTSTDPTNPYIRLCEDMFYNQIAVFKNDLYKQKILARNYKDDNQVAELQWKITDIDSDVQGADYAFRSGDKYPANDIIESVIDRYEIT